jgi:hypothetical protein
MSSQHGSDAAIMVTSFDALWGVEVRWHNLGDLHFGPRGLARRAFIYAAVIWALLAIVPAHVAPAAWALGWLGWWMKPLLACGLAWALSQLDVEGLRAHELLVPLALFVLGAKHFDGFHPCPPLGSRWRPGPLVLIPDGSSSAFAAVRYHGPGSVTSRRPATLSRKRGWRRGGWTVTQATNGRALLRLDVPADSAARFRAPGEGR